MKSDNKKKDDNMKKGNGAAGATIRPVTGETLLRYEVGFWRDLLNTESGALPPESVERMRQALALAERRLQDWYALPPCPGESSDGQPGTSADGERAIH